MAELELTRAPDDRRLYALGAVGTLRLRGRLWHAATAKADGTTWQLVRRGLLRRVAVASDASGASAGEFEPARGLRRGGTLRWAGREYALRSLGSWRGQRFALAEGDRELAVLDGMPSDRLPVEIAIADPAIEPGLLLFAAFVVRGLTLDVWSGVAAGSSVATHG